MSHISAVGVRESEVVVPQEKSSCSGYLSVVEKSIQK